MSELDIERTAAAFEFGISAQVPFVIYMSFHSSWEYGEALSILNSLIAPSQRSLASTRSSHTDFTIWESFASLIAFVAQPTHSFIHRSITVDHKSNADRIPLRTIDGIIFVVAFAIFASMAHRTHNFVNHLTAGSYSDLFAVPRIPRTSFAIRL